MPRDNLDLLDVRCEFFFGEQICEMTKLYGPNLVRGVKRHAHVFFCCRFNLAQGQMEHIYSHVFFCKM